MFHVYIITSKGKRGGRECIKKLKNKKLKGVLDINKKIVRDPSVATSRWRYDLGGWPPAASQILLG
jgi:hypothetical protein